MVQPMISLLGSAEEGVAVEPPEEEELGDTQATKLPKAPVVPPVQRAHALA